MNYDCCRNCTDRKEGCHSTCEKYKARKEEVNAEKKKVLGKKKLDGIYLGYMADARKAARRRNGKK